MLATSTTTQPQPVRIVIADDHPCMIDGMRFALRKFKHIQIVGDALNGVELIEKVVQQQPDVVFTDIEMPLMNGIEAAKEIHQRFPHIKLIAFTAFDASHYITDMMIGAKASGYDFIDLFTGIKTTDTTERISLANDITTIFASITYKGHLNRLLNLREKDVISFELWSDDLSWRFYNFFFDKYGKLTEIKIENGVGRSEMNSDYLRICSFSQPTRQNNYNYRKV